METIRSIQLEKLLCRMKEKNNSRVVQKLVRNMHRLYRDLLEEFGEQTIHDFRLDIKKLRAFLRMKRAGEPENKKLHLGKKLRLFYNTVGEVRTCQLQKGMVLGFCKDSGFGTPLHYLVFLHENEEAAKQKAREAALQFSMLNISQQLLKTSETEKPSHDARAFVLDKKVELRRCLSAVVLRDEDIHQVRKIFKDLLYVWPWILPFMTEFFPSKVFSKERCEQLTNRFGEFQDMCTALSLLQPSIINSVPDAAEQNVLQQFYFHCEKQKQALRNEIYAQLGKLHLLPENNVQVTKAAIDPATALQ